LEAYCVKCREKREIKDPIADFNKAAAPVTTGVCSVCGTKMYRIGKTPAHEGMVAPKREKPKKVRKGKLVIVESPAKAKTVGRFLGKDYTVRASVGHVRDLLRSEMSIDVENNFQPKYRIPNEKRKVVKELKAIAKDAEEIYLATDPDREGEAIAWHLQESIGEDADLYKRVVFHEITESAIDDAFNHPRGINMSLVDAQQARRVLDRLVGYSISPLLWAKVRSRLSAGRVQSVALRMIVERERDIANFDPEEYWSIAASFYSKMSDALYRAKLAKINGEDPQLPDQGTVDGVIAELEKSNFAISKVKKGSRKKTPSAPFITSTMQQEASRRLGFTAKRTMALAQQLYEGIDIGSSGTVGLITYMRTDSTNISEEAQREARNLILKTYGEEYLPKKPRVYKTRAKGAQEAHEAIRPTSVSRQPAELKAFLSRDQYRLYQLIWKRFLASQMANALYDTITVEITGTSTSGSDQYLFRTTGSSIQFQGFLAVYEEAQDEDKDDENGDSFDIPTNLQENEPQDLKELFPEQHFTQPPPRFTEASLVQLMEEHGIGRPSTYAAILSTIQERGYIYRENKRLYPTETGVVVNDLLVEHFPDIIEVGFTAKMEEDLDDVAGGKNNWPELISNFYAQFKPLLDEAEKNMPEKKAELEKIGRECPKCGHDLVIRWGRYGKFISCNNFPECRYTEPWLEKIGVACPKDGGDVVLRRTRKGRIFYGCSNYPECDFTSWKQPIAAKCPNCSGTLVIANKRQVSCMDCETVFARDEIEPVEQESA
jgi:DNA topoisomerase I